MRGAPQKIIAQRCPLSFIHLLQHKRLHKEKMRRRKKREHGSKNGHMVAN